MSEETRKVLEMLKEGKIGTEDAERLLERLAAGTSAAEASNTSEKAPEASAATTKKPRYLRILVERPGEKNVNVRMPLAFVRNSKHLLGFLPSQVTERLQERGIFLGISHLQGLSNEDFTQALEELNVDIDQEDGKKVKIYCE